MELKYISVLKETKLWNAGYCQLWDFSKANSCEEARIEAVTEIARICRGDKTIKDRPKLYQQLLTEHGGKAGEAFQFIPIRHNPMIGMKSIPNTVRFGYRDTRTMNVYLTNLRALLETEEPSEYYQDADCSEGFYVFKIKIPYMIAAHFLKHGQLSFMQASERSQKLREYYFPEDFYKEFGNQLIAGEWNDFCMSANQYDWDRYQKEYKLKQELTNKGSHGLAYTTMWIAGWKQDPSTWDNFFAVRTKKPAQREIIELANVIKDMMEK